MTQAATEKKPEHPGDPTGLRYPLAGVPEPGQALPVIAGVRWLRMPLPFALDHINLWLLEDGDGWTIVDCGYTSDATRSAWEAIARDVIGTRPVHRIVVTHYHPDHLGMAHWLTRTFGAEIWMTQAEYLTAHAVWDNGAGFSKEALVALYRRHGLDEARLAHLGLKGDVYRRGVPEVPKRYRRMVDGEEIAVGGRSWRVMVGYGHAPEHAALWCRDLGAFISGDMVLPRISTNVSVWGPEPEGDPLALYLSSLDRYRELPADTLVLPSHGRVFVGLRERVDALRDHHDARFADLLAACVEQPQSAADLIPVLFRRPLDTHQVFFAMGEAVAHINALWRRGRLERSVDPQGTWRFRAVDRGVEARFRI
jgi:glyoxylase-like metal-dependent hydrolase (beta-lactamase superfamily II)